MSENRDRNRDEEIEEYNFEHDKYMFSNHSGKQRTKKEASEHTNHFDPSGHTRKIATKLKNTEANRKHDNAKPATANKN